MPQANQPRKRRRRRGLSPRQRAWVNSAQWKAERKAAGKLALAIRRRKPRCGAKRRDGLPCKRLPTPGKTRCKFHGGASLGGNAWHVIQWPDDPVKRLKKEAYVRRQRAAQAARVAAMTPERRAKYEAWRATHTPGSRKQREMARRDREMWRLLSRPRPPAAPDPRLAVLKAQADLLRVERERLEALLREQELKQEKIDE